jgi:hypothetical protein
MDPSLKQLRRERYTQKRREQQQSANSLPLPGESANAGIRKQRRLNTRRSSGSANIRTLRDVSEVQTPASNAAQSQPEQPNDIQNRIERAVANLMPTVVRNPISRDTLRSLTSSAYFAGGQSIGRGDFVRGALYTGVGQMVGSAPDLYGDTLTRSRQSTTATAAGIGYQLAATAALNAFGVENNLVRHGVQLLPEALALGSYLAPSAPALRRGASQVFAAVTQPDQGTTSSSAEEDSIATWWQRQMGYD